MGKLLRGGAGCIETVCVSQCDMRLGDGSREDV